VEATPDAPRVIAAHETTLIAPGPAPPLRLVTLPSRDIVPRGERLATALPDALGVGFGGFDYEDWIALADGFKSEGIWERVSSVAFPFANQSNWIRTSDSLRWAMEPSSQGELFGTALAALVASGDETYYDGLLSRMAAESAMVQAIRNRDAWALDVRQIGIALSIASLAARARTGAAAGEWRLKSYLRYEIPFALSPETEKSRLGDVLPSVRQVTFLPLIGGAIGATAQLGAGDFLVAGEALVAGGAATLFIAGVTSVVERIVSWGQKQ
jgi:hypothetical protein